MANDLYDAESFPKAVSLYEQVYQYSPKSDMGEVAYYRLANAIIKIKIIIWLDIILMLLCSVFLTVLKMKTVFLC